MKNPVAVTVALLLCSLVITFSAGAVDAPHYDPAAGIICSSCHTVQQTLGSTGYNNICQNCHRPGDPSGGGKPITLADAANPFGNHSSNGVSRIYQTSHRWDGSDTSPAAGAQPPLDPLMTANGLRDRTGGQLACVRCHNQHENSRNDGFLRMANNTDQMCLDCHRSRNVQSHTKGSHPVGIPYIGTKAGFKAITSSSADLSAAGLAKNLKSGAVSCSTCHGVHFTDSRSSTPDGSADFANLSSGDGYLLRADRRGANSGAGNDSANICSTCHAGKTSHNMAGQNIQCGDCHGAHVEYDPNDPAGVKGTNIYLVRRAVPRGANGSGVIFFRYSGSSREYRNDQGTGVCQGCHAVPAPGGIYPAEHGSSDPNVCNSCHNHNSSSGSFSGACNMCHGYPPSTNTVGGATGKAAGYTRKDESTTPHAYHASAPYSFACSECHNGNSHNSGTFTDVFIDKSGIRAGASATYTPGTFTCSAVYCHSAGQGAGGTVLAGGDYAAPTWANSTFTCGSCHKDMKTSAAATGSHVVHAQGNNNIACSVCHSGYTESSVSAATHVNSRIDLSFSGAAVGAGYSQGTNHATANGYGRCSNVSCHADPYGSSFVDTPDWGASAGCAACHNGAATINASGPATGSHAKHSSAACVACHNAGTSATTVPAVGHLNSNIDVTNGYPATVAKHAAGTYTGSCSAAACHADPYGTGILATPVWGTAAGCAACHAGTGAFTGTGNGPSTGSHNKHMSGISTCGSCHAGAVAGISGGTAHISGVIDVSNGYPASITKHAPGAYSGSCSTAVCHASPYGTATVTSPVWGITADCAACHNGTGAFTGTGNAPATGSHDKHMAKLTACGDCHAGAVANSNGGTAHADENIDVINGYPANVAKHAIGTYAGSCTTTCHSATTAAVTTPVWGAASTCAGCHASIPATGSHNLHSGLIAVCADCHTGATQDTSAGVAHLDGNIDVINGYPPNVAKHAAGSGYSTCSTASCHASSYGTGSVTTPVWGVEIGSHCAGCHNGTGAFDATLGSPSTGSHALHMIAAASCGDCHSGAVKNSTGGAGHKDGNIDVTGGYPADVTKHAAGAYTGSCSTTTCHGTTSPVWGANTSNNGCTKCHGIGTVTVTAANYEVVAPSGTSSDTGQVSTGKIGAHQTHLKYFNGLSQQGADSQARCQVCHTIPGTNSHASGASTPVFTGLALGTGTYSTTYSAGTCSVYCHNPTGSGGTIAVGNAPAAPTVSWTNAAYIADGPLKTAANCDKCHLSPNASRAISASFSHAAVALADDCASCHKHNGDNTSSDATHWHMDGVLYGASGSCNGCHSYDSNGSTYTSGKWSGGTWGTTNYGGYTTAEGSGAHATHINYIKTRLAIATPLAAAGTFGAGEAANVCGTCHTNTPANHTMGATGTTLTQGRSINFGDSNFKIGTAGASLLFGSTNPVYSGVSGTSSSATGKTCSNLSCHYFTTPLWSSY